MVRRSLGILILLTILLAGLPAQVLAVAVGANCGAGGGAFITQGTADNWQDHGHDGALYHYWYYGRAVIGHNWGFETGWETGTVNGPNLWNPNARCIT